MPLPHCIQFLTFYVTHPLVSQQKYELPTGMHIVNANLTPVFKYNVILSIKNEIKKTKRSISIFLHCVLW